MRHVLILAGFLAFPQAGSAQDDPPADAATDTTTATTPTGAVCPETHYACGAGICCPKD